MANESTGNPRLYEMIENLPEAFPAVVRWLKVASRPVAGPWPPHQEPRPDPSDSAL
jgi:hypothetical protein